MKRVLPILTLVALLGMSHPAQAVNINLLNIQTTPPQQNPLANMYGQAYGFTPQQVAPAMLAPPQEVPGILQIAQAAGQVPMTVYMMRQMGMSVPSILSTFALGPSVLAGGAGPLYGSNPYSPNFYNQYPTWNRFLNPFLVETARVTFLRDVLRVKPQFIPQIPYSGLGFHQALLRPYHPVHGTWMPPGIAKKYGLWMPPGQAKKVGWWPNGKGRHPGKHWKGNGGPGHKGHQGWKGPGKNSLRDLNGQKVHFGPGKSNDFKRGPVQAKNGGGVGPQFKAKGPKGHGGPKGKPGGGPGGKGKGRGK